MQQAKMKFCVSSVGEDLSYGCSGKHLTGLEVVGGKGNVVLVTRKEKLGGEAGYHWQR